MPARLTVMSTRAPKPDGATPNRRDVIVIGGSAGALEALRKIVACLPPDLPASMAVVLHLKPTATSALARILNREGALRAVTPRNGDPLQPGHIYVCIPDHHLELTPQGIRQTHGPRING